MGSESECPPFCAQIRPNSFYCLAALALRIQGFARSPIVPSGKPSCGQPLSPTAPSIPKPTPSHSCLVVRRIIRTVRLCLRTKPAPRALSPPRAPRSVSPHPVSHLREENDEPHAPPRAASADIPASRGARAAQPTQKGNSTRIVWRVRFAAPPANPFPRTRLPRALPSDFTPCAPSCSPARPAAVSTCHV